jgi:hypothetical protein
MEMRIRNGTSRIHGILEIRKRRCKFVDVDKFVTNEQALEHTLMRA